jgi:hypothetical protein
MKKGGKTMSDKQMMANQLNARKSIGPKTPASPPPAQTPGRAGPAAARDDGNIRGIITLQNSISAKRTQL